MNAGFLFRGTKIQVDISVDVTQASAGWGWALQGPNPTAEACAT
jgi:hypothetical protein